jgi:S1-C subfamily serine protease
MGKVAFTADARAFVLVWDELLRKPIGTGFALLRPDWIATAKHVVIENGLPRPKLSVQYFRGGRIEAKVYVVHPEIDVAVIKLEADGPCKIPLFPSYEGYTGQKGLIAVGYTPSRNSEGIVAVTGNLVDGFTTEMRSRSSSDEDVIVFKAPFVECGHSGGPLVGEGGGVVGMVIEIFEKPPEGRFARATSIRSLLAALDFRKDWKMT